MAGRRSGGNFDNSYSRRPQQNMDMQSLLGSPPAGRQQNSMNQGGYGGQNQSFNNSNNFDQSYSRRMDNKGNGDYFGGGNNNFGSGGGGGGNYGGDYNNRGGNQQQNFQQGRGGNNNPVWDKQNSNRGGGMGNNSDNWNRGGNQGGGYGQGSNIGQSSDQQQQVVMVVPQGNTGAGGIMGMVPVQATPNPFNMMQQQGQQRQMQVIVGNLPGLNADAFGQQILAAASNGPQYGQNQNVMMGMMNQRQQQQQYGRNIGAGGDGGRRFSARQSNGSQQNRSPGRAIARRSDMSAGGNANKAINRGSTNNTSAISRGNRKRGVVLRDRHGPTDEIASKRAKGNGPAKVGGQKNVPKGKGNNRQAQNKKKAEIKAAAEAAKKEGEVKKEGDATDGDAEVKDEEKKDGEPEEKKPSKYDEFPNAFLVCKICQKVMSDGASFESHLNGRAHVALVKILEERFQKRTDLLKFESKLSEQEIGIEMERQRRAGKSGHGGKGSKNYCKMCDCNYTVNWGTHKVSMGHRVLKEYLHPTCRYCNTNFVHRMDWVNHLYSLNHFKKLTELKEQGVDVEEQESSNQNELFSINLEIGKDEHANHVLLIRSTDFKIPMKEDLKEMLKDEKGEIVLPEGEIDIPKEFVENQAYGEEAMMNVEGACCKVCRTYIGNRSDIEAHVKSKPHFGMYVSYLKKIVKYRELLIAEKEKAEKDAIEAAEKAKKKAEEEAAAGLKKEEADKAKEETPMETDNVETPKIETPAVEAAVVESKPAVVEETKGEVAVVEKKKEEVAATPVTETPKKAPVATPKPAQNRGGPRGGRGGSPGGRGSPRGGRGSPGGRGARGAGRGNVRGVSTPGRGGNWSGGQRGGARGRGYQR